MIATNNRQAILRLAGKSLRANAPRNFITICAIVLTTLLLTSVFMMSFSLNESMQRTQMRTAGSDFHGSFKYLTREEAGLLVEHPLIKEYGTALMVGRAAGESFRDHPLEIDYIDQNEARHSFIQFTAGGLPEQEQEIAISDWVLQMLGVTPKLGATVELDLDIDGEIVSKEFVVSGIYPSDKNLSMAALAFVSESFAERNLAHIDPKQSRLQGSYDNTIRLDVMFSSSFGIEKKLQQIVADTGVEAAYGVNWAYSSVGLQEDPQNMLPFIVLILVIMLSGYLLIYNIFHISVVRDIRFYGLLKTIGTTPRQLRRLITIQANWLYLLALPFGLALGYGLGAWLMPLLMQVSAEQMDMSLSANPLIFVGAALFAYATVRVAAGKPGRLAGRIAPVEAVKFAGIGSRVKGRSKRSTHGAKLYRMAFSNLLRQKKKLGLMLASLSLSLILFSIIFTVISSFSINQYLSSFIAGDLVVKENVTGPSGIPGSAYVPGGTKASLTEELCQRLSEVEGIVSVDKVYYGSDVLKLNPVIRQMLEPLAAREDPGIPMFSSVLDSGEVPLQLHGLDPVWYNVIGPRDIVAGSFDAQRFASGDYVVMTEALLDSDQYARYYQPGDRFTLDAGGKSYEVMAVLQSDALYAAGTQFYGLGGFNVYWPAQEFVKVVKDPVILSATLHVEADMKGQVEAEVRSMVASSSNLTVKSREDYKGEMQSFIRIFQTVGYGLSLIIALIGILNFINTVITGMLSRRNEFAILESIGMTRKQLKRMLMFEGLYSVAMTGLVTGTAGLALTYAVAKGISSNLAFMEFRMNQLPMLGVLPMLAALALIVTLAAYRNMSRSTMVERLRETE
ncbi:ABC transporter permease [Paenibacillus senegalimassiliensis]|uniref:ABC transporter permease n=1 Tax=Paenibacillus senegalimassiliensis TaxID=1737426 RepID=UPI00073E5321|nr:ABC transporter permease [Paenibacillus senegalimassiliensis]